MFILLTLSLYTQPYLYSEHKIFCKDIAALWVKGDDFGIMMNNERYKSNLNSLQDLEIKIKQECK